MPKRSAHKPETRLARLKKIKDHLIAGKLVQNRTLRAWLNGDEYDHYLSDCNAARSNFDPKDKPNEIKEYERLLKSAGMAQARVGRYRGESAYNAETLALTKYERAIEYLQENIKGDFHLEMWLDRPIDIRFGGETRPDKELMPLPITSRSRNRRQGGYLFLSTSVKNLKLDAVERAIENLESPPNDIEVTSEQIAAQTARLRRLMGD